MPAIAANALAMAYGDIRKAYQIVDRIGIRVLRDPYTDKPNVSFYTTKRVGGGVVNFEALKIGKDLYVIQPLSAQRPGLTAGAFPFHTSRSNPMRQDLHNNIQVLSVFDPIDLGTGNTAKVGEIIDRQDAMALEFIIQTGSLADADATFTVLVEDGDDSRPCPTTPRSTTPTCSAPRPAHSFIFSDDNKIAKIGYVGSKRYVRLTVTPANNTGAVLISACAILGSLRAAPNTTQLA